MAKVSKTLSFQDVEFILERQGKKISDFTEEQVLAALFSIGFSMTELEVEKDVLHRPMFSANNQPWKGNRYVGWERQDREWMLSGKSSLENVINSQDDFDHKRDLLMMSAQPTPTADIMDHMSNKRDTGKGEKV